MTALAAVLALATSQVMVLDEGNRLGRKLNLDFTGAGVTCVSTGPSQATCTITSGGGGGAPTTATYWTGSADAGLSAEFNLGALATGLVLNTAGTPSAYGGTGAAPANQWVKSLSASGAGTWAQPAFTDISGTAASAQLPGATSGAQGAVIVPASACDPTTGKALWNGTAFVCGTDQTGGGGGGISPLTVAAFGGF